MKGTSPLAAYAAYLATLVLFEFLVSSWLANAGLSAYRSEKISILLAAALLIAMHRLFIDQGMTNISFSQPSTAHLLHVLIFSVLLGIAGVSLIGVQVFLTAQFSELQAAASWNFTGHPGELEFHYEYLGMKSGLINLALFASTQFIVLPLAEEIYFKGIILEKLLSKYSIVASALITSTLFAIAHDNKMFISVFTFSVLTCFYYRRCRNIGILTSIHGLGNLYDWLYSGFGGITFLEAKHIDELNLISTWRVEIALAVVSCLFCCLYLIRLSLPAPPSPSPGSASRDPDPA